MQVEQLVRVRVRVGARVEVRVGVWVGVWVRVRVRVRVQVEHLEAAEVAQLGRHGTAETGAAQFDDVDGWEVRSRTSTLAVVPVVGPRSVQATRGGSRGVPLAAVRCAFDIDIGQG